MLTKFQKLVMYVISIVTIVISIITCIPFRTLVFLKDVEGLFVIENIIKFIAFPIVMLGLVVYPNILKYKEIKARDVRSTVVNTLSYLPLFVYTIAVLILGLHTLSFNLIPMEESSHSILIVLSVCYLAFVLFATSFINRVTMNFYKMGNALIDVFTVLVFAMFILLSYRVCSTYQSSYGVKFGFIYSSVNFDPYLFFIYLGVLILAAIYLIKVIRMIKDEQTVVYVVDASVDDTSEMICDEYNNAYNDILDDFEDYFDEETMSEAENGSEDETEEEVTKECAEEDTLAVEEQVEESEEEEVVENLEELPVYPVFEDVDDYHERKGKAIKEMEELNKLLVETDKVNDEEMASKVDELTKQIEAEKELLEKERNEFEQVRLAYVAEINALNARVQEIEDANKPEDVEEVKEVAKKKTVKPPFEVVLDYVNSIKEESWVVKGEIKEGSGTIKYFKDKVLFLMLQLTSSDYRISFITTEKKWNHFLHSSKYISIPKNAKGDNWLKFVNKPSSTVTAGYVKSLVREACKGVDEQIEIKARLLQEQKEQKALERKAAKDAQKMASAE